LGGGPQTPEPAWSDFAGALNQAGAKAKEAGLQLGYHNHSPEVEPYEGNLDRRPIDTLMEETDPELVHFELDIYWCWKGGVDPIDLLKQYPGRFRQFHVKDMNKGGDFTTPGKGTIDFVRVFKAGKKLDRINQYIIEQDNAGENAIKSARAGFKLLREVRF
ncbi:MAG TPA: sugar phosphate isomerase/epimerase, partial [Actinomycetota bacterium]|nr:sugar phosphate isomerase/epimerase [Actinomycetota bacterium]